MAPGTHPWAHQHAHTRRPINRILQISDRESLEPVDHFLDAVNFLELSHQQLFPLSLRLLFFLQDCDQSSVFPQQVVLHFHQFLYRIFEFLHECLQPVDLGLALILHLLDRVFVVAASFVVFRLLAFETIPYFSDCCGRLLDLRL